jgi:hypothetical protein
MKLSIPKHLRPSTRVWFQSVLEDYALDPHHVKLLTAAAECWDRLVGAREAIDKFGTTYIDRFNCPRARPEVAIERDCRIQFARLIR